MTIPTLPESPVPPKLPPHVVRVKNKTGKPYLYFIRHRGTARAERAVRLPDDAASSEFWTEYAKALGSPLSPAKTDTIEKLVEAWQASREWKQLANKTRTEWQRYCRRICAAWGPLEVRGIEPKHVM